MRTRILISIATALLVATPTLLTAGPPVPVGLRHLKPYQVVEEVMALQTLLSLTDAQFAALDDLSQSIQKERHRFIRHGGKSRVRHHVPMVSREEAFDRALQILSADQQVRLLAHYPEPIKVPEPRRARHRAPGKA